MIKQLLASCLALALSAPDARAALPELNAQFGSAGARTEDNQLIISTGVIQRTFTWTGQGLVTTSLKNLETGKQWVNTEPAWEADWSYPGWLPVDATASLVSLAARQGNDEGFTSDHLEIVAEIHYPTQHLTLKQVIWAYPGAHGLRQQLWAKGDRAAKVVVTDSGDAPFFSVMRGQPYTNPKAVGKRPHWEISTLHDPKTVSLRLANLDRKKQYVVGLSWWDYGNGGRTESVDVSSVDGETRVTVVPPTVLPGWVKDKQPADTHTFALPQQTNADGTVTIHIQKVRVASANVSELWLYEIGADQTLLWAIDPLRKRQLETAAPEGARLVAYLNAGGEGKSKADHDSVRSGRVDYLPVDTAGMQLSAAGYYSDTQHRNTADTPVLKQATLEGTGYCDWANLLFIEDGRDGLILVKESHKTVQTPGVDTGAFGFNESGLANTGWCLALGDLALGDLSADDYKWVWGSWVIVHKAGKDEREQAVKRFDRIRFPTNKARDMWTVMCTWGHSKDGDGRTYAYEDQVLLEMDHVADLGIDMILIDDGWQAVAGFDKEKYPQPHQGWYPHPGTYPTSDWSNVAAKAKNLGLRLGLWAASSVSTDEMVWNWERLGQEQFKIDFARLGNHAQIDAMRRKARDFMLQTDQKCIISWDTTEAAPRYGFYLFREYGNVHFMNRKPEQPGNVLYVPWLALRDFWLLAHYQNLNKWQLVIQNPEVVVKEATDRGGKTFTSDAHRHSVDYCMATALMGTPEFMGVSRYYSNEARDILRPLIKRYKEVRGDIWDSTVYAIGDQPSNNSWTGFQGVRPDGRSGYLTIFRELHNKQPSAKIALRFLEPGTRLKLTEITNGHQREATLDEQKRIELSIDRTPGFVFLKYERL